MRHIIIVDDNDGGGGFCVHYQFRLLFILASMAKNR